MAEEAVGTDPLVDETHPINLVTAAQVAKVVPETNDSARIDPQIPKHQLVFEANRSTRGLTFSYGATTVISVPFPVENISTTKRNDGALNSHQNLYPRKIL